MLSLGVIVMLRKYDLLCSLRYTLPLLNAQRPRTIFILDCHPDTSEYFHPTSILGEILDVYTLMATLI